MVAYLAILILRVLFFILIPQWGEFGSQFWHYIAFSFVLYYIAIIGYSNIIKQSTLRNENLKMINVFDDENSAVKTEAKVSSNESNDLKWKNEPSALMIEKQNDLSFTSGSKYLISIVLYILIIIKSIKTLT